VLLLGVRRGSMTDTSGLAVLKPLGTGRFDVRVLGIGYMPRTVSIRVVPEKWRKVTVRVKHPRGWKPERFEGHGAWPGQDVFLDTLPDPLIPELEVPIEP